MRLSHLLLILPFASAASVKLTKRRLSDPLLARRQLHRPAPKHDIEAAPFDLLPRQRRDSRRRTAPNAGVAPAQPEVEDKTSTSYTTIRKTILGLAPGTETEVNAGAGAGNSVATVFQTLEVTVTQVDAPQITPGANAAESVDEANTVPASSTNLGEPTKAGVLPVVETAASSTITKTTTTTVSPAIGVDGKATAATRATPNPANGKPGQAVQPISGPLVLAEAEPWVYTIDMKIGAGGKVVPMLMDTGSFSFWAADTSCANCVSNGMVGALVSDPSTCKKYSTAYGTGGFSGCIVETSVEIGPYKLEGMAMAAAVTIQDDLAVHGAAFSGMFGLAMPGTEGTDTPMSRLLSDGLVSDPWVGLRLQRAGEGDSEIIFGDALTSASMYGDPAFHIDMPQRKGGENKYNITLDSLSIFGEAVVDSHITGRGVILDSGTSNIVVPKATYPAILSKLSAGDVKDPTFQKPMLPCKAVADESEAMSFSFAGIEFAVPWKDIVGPPIVEAPGYCEPRIQTIGTDDWILGDAFLVNVYHAINTQTGGVQLWRLKPTSAATA